MKTQILVIGRHEEIMETLLRIINRNEAWEGMGALSDTEAMQVFDEFHFELVLLSSGIPEDSEKKLCTYFRQQQPSIIIIQHYGGGSGLLSNELLEALEKRNSL